MTLTPINKLSPAFAAIVLLCVAANTQAADYNVELIVYAQLQGPNASEQWPAPSALPDTTRALLIGENATRMLDGPRSMQAIADTIRRSKQYRLLLHWYWQQPAQTAAQAQAVLVQIPNQAGLPVNQLPENLSRLAMNVSSEQSAPLLDGTVKLIDDDILQVDVDLIYRDAGIGVPVQLKELRRLRSGELHYLDHSRFGVITRVTPATEAVPTQQN